MGKLYDSIGPDHAAFIGNQPVFFVATSPLTPDGHVNLSPKGLDTVRIVDTNRVMYLDLTGSGNETAAHLVENGRLTLMFCAFDGSPKILRVYCRGRVVNRASDEWQDAVAQFPVLPGIRQIIIGDVVSVQTSCGFGVPVAAAFEQRTQLTRWAESKGEDGLVEYRRTRNAVSLDGLVPPSPDCSA